MKISIIIPVYNTEEFLRPCLDSILSQSFADYEVLLIDDGSSDGSGSLCDAYAQKDGRILVYHKENGGVSSARNLGLNHAKGEWIYFVDSDDEILPGGLQTLVDGISEDVDLVGGGYEQHGIDGELLEAVTDRVVVSFSQEESLLMLYPGHSLYYSYLGYMCLWLFRRQIIEENKLRFDPTIRIKEDTLFIVQYICQSKRKTRFNSSPVYKYKIRNNSAMSELWTHFNPDYQTSFDSVIRMSTCIQSLPRVGKELSCAAKSEVLNRVYMVYSHMMRFNMVDKETVSLMKYRSIKEVGLSFFILYQLRRYLRKAGRKINKFIRIN